MRRHHHPNIPKYYTCYDYKSSIVLIQEFVPGITLHQKMKKAKTLSQDYALNLVKNLLEVLHYIHKNGYVHRDVKPSNIMLTKTTYPGTNRKYDCVKLIDFGLSGKLEPGDDYEDSLSDKCGTVGYLAPELLGNRGGIENSSSVDSDETPNSRKSGRKYNAKVDIFSLGIVFFEMIVGKNPFKHKNYETTILRNYKGTINLSALFGYVDSDILALMKKLISTDP